MIVSRLVGRSLRQHGLSTAMTVLAVALAGGLLLSVWVLKAEGEGAFTRVNAGFDAVLGARGSKLQLVLNAVFHLEASPGNVGRDDYLFIKRHPAVKRAIPIAVGDNLRGFRIVGTEPELFTEVEYAPGRRHALAAGHLWTGTAKEAVLGSVVAEDLGLRVGDTFHPFHGLLFDERHEHAETYVVTGVLAPSGSPADRVVWISLQGVQTMSGHDVAAAESVSAVLVQLRSPAAGFQLDLLYNRQGNRLTFAYPVAAILGDLFAKIGWFGRILELVAVLVALVSALGVLVAVHHSMEARRRDLAILRALGARRRTLFGAVVLEAASIGGLGALGAFAVHAAIMVVAAGVVRARTGVDINPCALHPAMLWLPPGVVALCACAGLFPAWRAYRTDVAEGLAPVS